MLELDVPMLDHKPPASVEMVPRSWQDQAALRASFPTHSEVQKAVALHLRMEQQQRWLNWPSKVWIQSTTKSWFAGGFVYFGVPELELQVNYILVAQNQWLAPLF